MCIRDRVKGEFGVNGVTTQTTQTHQSTQSKKSTLSDDDKKILDLVHNYPSMSQREYANELGWNLDLSLIHIYSEQNAFGLTEDFDDLYIPKKASRLQTAGF